MHPTGIDGDGYVIDGIDPGDTAFRLPVPPPCPWDRGDGARRVGITDFLVLLGQRGRTGIGTSCDFGLGAAGVDVEEFLDLLAHRGPCP